MIKKAILILGLILFSTTTLWAYPVDSLLRVLDACITNHHLYVKKAGKSDSLSSGLFKRSMQLIENGFPEEAKELLDASRSRQLSEEERADYYGCRIKLNEYLYSCYQTDTLGTHYLVRKDAYQDSLFQLLPDGTSEKRFYEAIRAIKKQEYNTARQIFSRLMESEINNPALLMPVYKEAAWLATTMGHQDEADCYHVKEAIVNIKGRLNDYSGLIEVALMQMRHGNLEEAGKYLDDVRELAGFSSSPLLAMQLNRAQSLLKEAGYENYARQKQRIYFFIFVLSVMAVILLFSLRKINKQMGVIETAKKQVDDLNTDLEDKNRVLEKINEELTFLTDKLTMLNSQLNEANLLKEEYIGHFLNQCSEYLHKLQDYKKMVNRKIQAGQLEELFKQNAGNRMMQEEMKELYRKFDVAFLKIFPHFVERFNELLMPEEQFILKKDELLNTELRLFALIRLGVKDSSQIADFLGYSVTTIYTYRTRIKNKSAGNRDEFENQVMKISQ